MHILYCRCSTLDQKTDRQRISESDYDMVVEDKVSGSVPFFERSGGLEISNYIYNGILKSLSVWSIDRLGRDLRDIINTLHFFTEKGINVHFVSQGFSTLRVDGKENPISKLMISILGIVAEMERTQSKERQIEGIRLAKLKGNVYLGRKPGTKEDTLQFLSKDKNRRVLDYLKKGYKGSEISKILSVDRNTVSKVKKLAAVDGHISNKG